ncbi:MAG: NADH:ubiquinone oxidoreductase subunit RnfA [bacterium]|nr:MAG: NADH:ubiquinone oxidoreductase subunit RnfA [bacterium]
MARRHRDLLLLVAMAFLLALSVRATQAIAAESIIRNVRILAPNHLRVELDPSVTDLSADNFRFTADRAPDVPFTITEAVPEPGHRLLLTIRGRLDASQAYQLETRQPPSERPVHPAPWALLLTVVISSALINNFVFTRYLGLCIFFGVSKKRDTAVGMGLTFILVMLVTAMMSWMMFTWVMSPLSLKFLQVLVFIGTVAFVVQALDTILKKVNPGLHSRFGIYLMLITTNCIILAVPLLNAAANASFGDALALSIGSGVGFALALFLMSCARERVELARVPKSFEGLPIAFALAGLFALAFMGFSGLNFFR